MKKLLILTLLLFITPTLVNAETKYLYDVLKNEAENNGLAREYTGEHHDSFTEEPFKKIYHWYAENDEEGKNVLKKNNVIFANFCWQIIRTTDTGGVKLIYNGTPSNGKCFTSDISIGRAPFTTYENMDYLGSTGYMHNELYSTSLWKRYNFGRLNQTGNKIALDEYDVVSNNGDNCQPYIFDSSNQWKMNLSCLERSTAIIFKVNEDGDYIFNYNLEQDWYSDEFTLYINNVKKNVVGTDKNGSIVLNNLKNTDEIKIDFYAYKPKDAHTKFTFYIGRPVGELVDTR